MNTVMKKIFNSIPAVLLLVLFAFLYGCKKDPDMATLTTTAVSSITTNSASTGGNITDDGGAEVTARGVCWGTSTNPTITGSKTSDGTGIGSFTSSISGLSPNTMYYVRAYATNSAGTAYGNELSFTTEPIVGATLTTTAVTSITSTTAVSGGNITDDGGADITARGVCWSETANPTTADSKTENGIGTGSFSSNLTGLTAGTLYHVRAYATNSSGTTYGNDVTFTTLAVAPTVTTAAVTTFAQTTATAGGNVTATGGADITERGVYYGTAADPVATGTKINAATGGAGAFTVNLTGLTPGTQYHVVAFATNSAETGYGSEVTFTTSPVALATVTTAATVTSITEAAAVSGGTVSANGGGTITARGVCWGTSANPTLGVGNFTTESGELGTFTSNITGLEDGTVYYVRAYATNSAGTAYGSTSVKFLTKVVDVDDNLYNTVEIGTQIWMAENLKTTHFNNEDPISEVQLPNDWINLNTAAYCWYNNDEATYGSVYGALYNWYAVEDGTLCPEGWSVPTDEDWTALTTFLGGESVAGGKLKEEGTTHWLTPNTDATDEFGFTALPGGFRYRLDGNFNDLGELSYWWTSTEDVFNPSTHAYHRQMFYDQASVYRAAAYKTAGKYIRCIKD